MLDPIEDVLLIDCAPKTDGFREEIIAGLTSTPKRIPSKFFYDARGAQLFEEITQLPEYYLTRTERTIFDAHLSEMAAMIGPNARVLEFGSGAGIKTKQLLRALDKPEAYIPVDISREQLIDASLALMDEFPELEVLPICADYSKNDWIDRAKDINASLIFFPGSTIGNFTPVEAIQFLKQARSLFKDGDGKILIGFDLRKDPAIIEAAYNDAAGITAEFNLNLIDRFNIEFVNQGVSLSRDDFEHYAFFNADESRIEMHLIVRRDFTIELDGNAIAFQAGEDILTEYSYKYTSAAFEQLLHQAGFTALRRWHDEQQAFEVILATA